MSVLSGISEKIAEYYSEEYNLDKNEVLESLRDEQTGDFDLNLIYKRIICAEYPDEILERLTESQLDEFFAMAHA